MKQYPVKRLRPFFSFYGAKWRAAPYYPTPEYETVVEPFAGSAQYSLLHHQRKVVLYDVDPVIAGLWDYLIRVSEFEVMSLPLKFDHVDDLNVCQEAKWLLGFWVNSGNASPCKQPSAWMRSGNATVGQFWGEKKREIIASQLRYIRHWEVHNLSYIKASNIKATYFIDPPYSGGHGRHYKYHDIDFDHLATWCKDRKGQVIVCEAGGADWLPFKSLRTVKAMPTKNGKKYSKEVVWVNDSRKETHDTR